MANLIKASTPLITDKGNLKPAVSKTIRANDLEVLMNALEGTGFAIEGNSIVKTYEGEVCGTIVYTIIGMTVSTKHPSERAKSTKVAKEVEVFELA